MMHVFYNNVGRMLYFDPSLSYSTVEHLKKTIQRLHSIEAQNIMLLVSGGVVLRDGTIVGRYNGGQKSNPIHMFSRGNVELPSVTYFMQPNLNIEEQVKLSLHLPVVFETVVKRAQIAHRMHEMASEDERLCVRLVYEQHLQQQGWSAVVATMEDLIEEFRKRFVEFCKAFDRHFEHRSDFRKLLQTFPDDLSKLSLIPILPGLMPLAGFEFHDNVFSTHSKQSVMMGANTDNEASAGDVQNIGAGATGFESAENVNDKSCCSTSPNDKLQIDNDSNQERSSNSLQTSIASNKVCRLNLLQWIKPKDPKFFNNMADKCKHHLDIFGEKEYEYIKKTAQNIIRATEKSNFKEIRGLSERLCKLEELKYKISSMAKDQKALSTAFQQNQSRALNSRDTSILPDLCASHSSQLLVMLGNHDNICRIRELIVKAKIELNGTLNAFFAQVGCLETSMRDIDSSLYLYNKSLKRVESYIHIIDQIHQTPKMYIAAVTEVMRRQIYSTQFLSWASKLAEDFDSIHSEEMKRRQQFNMNFEGHFLNNLFPGMADMPPALGNQKYFIFDADMPNITEADIDIINKHSPAIASEIKLPDMEQVKNFFTSRLGTHQRERFEEMQKQKQEQELATEQLTHVMGEDEQSPMVVSGKIPLISEMCELHKDTSSDEESETDTVTGIEIGPPNAHQSITTSTSEIQQLIPAISKSTTTDQLVTQSVETLTDENSESIRKEIENMRVMLATMSKFALDCIHLARSNLQAFREESITQKDDMQSHLQTLTDKWTDLRMHCEAREQELALQYDLKDDEINKLNDEIKKLDLKSSEENELSRSNMAELEKKCATLEAQLEELTEKLSQQDKEKEEAILQVSEQLLHEHKTEIESLTQSYKMMTSMKRSPSDLNLEHNPLGDNVIEKDLHENTLSQLGGEFNVENEPVIAAIEMERSIWQSQINPLISESEKANVTMLREMLEKRTHQLLKENYQLKARLGALTNEKGNNLPKDEYHLEKDLNTFKNSTCEQLSLTSSISSGSSHELIVNLNLVSIGGLVFVGWDTHYSQFMVIQNSSFLYFVHSESLTALNLHYPQTDKTFVVPMPSYGFGRVIEIQYCVSRTDYNRYHVDPDTIFYIVKLAPVANTSQFVTSEYCKSFSTSISRSVSESNYDSGFSNDFSTASTGVTSTESIVSLPLSATLTTATTSSNIDNINKDVSDAAVGNTIPLATSPTTENKQESTLNITSVTEEDEKEENENLIAVSQPVVTDVIDDVDFTTAADDTEYSVELAAATVTETTQNDGKLCVTSNTPNTNVSTDETSQTSASPFSFLKKISTRIASNFIGILPSNPEQTNVDTSSEDEFVSLDSDYSEEEF